MQPIPPNKKRVLERIPLEKGALKMTLLGGVPGVPILVPGAPRGVRGGFSGGPRTPKKGGGRGPPRALWTLTLST